MDDVPGGSHRTRVSETEGRSFVTGYCLARLSERGASDRLVLSCPEVLPATGTSFVDRRSADIGFIDLLIRVGAYG